MPLKKIIQTICCRITQLGFYINRALIFYFFGFQQIMLI